MTNQEAKITFRITNEKKELIREKASKIGLGMAGFCKHIVLREINKEDQE